MAGIAGFRRRFSFSINSRFSSLADSPAPGVIGALFLLQRKSGGFFYFDEQ
jgi:hypothetical protein